MKRVLVTGAQGFIGRYVTTTWIRRDPDVEIIGIGRSTCSDRSFTHHITYGSNTIRAPLTESLRVTTTSSRYRYASIDFLDHDTCLALLRDVKPNILVHLASGLRDDPSDYLFRTNVLGTEQLYEAVVGVRAHGCSVIVISSGSVYGPVSDENIPIGEDLPVAPFDMYSISKCAQERVALMLGRRFQIPTIIARVFNVVGPGQDERHFCGCIASQIAVIEANQRPPEIAIEPMITTRDFIDVRDVAQSLIAIAEGGEDGSTYNVGSGREVHVQAVFDKLLSLSRFPKPLTVHTKEPRASDMLRNVAQVSRLNRLGVYPETSLERSLSDVLDYYRSLYNRSSAK